ncbi:TetR/AcrR family transcriptional regulator, partial [Dermacoccus nishinomiyaensis]|uniref:TetR/AcrR family transcriptional regulator n=1 Tax=Dermacoccus nishinomiyaensis TaxID=1274 RepID=UPI00248EB02A
MTRPDELELLRTRGPRGVTVEAVTGRSGVAKTTIYRRYSDRRDMLAAALSSITSATTLDDEADARGRFRWVIEHAVDAVEGGIGGLVLRRGQARGRQGVDAEGVFLGVFRVGVDLGGFDEDEARLLGQLPHERLLDIAV